MTAELDAAAIARWWHEQSAAQGLPDTFEPATIARVVALALGSGARAGPYDDGAPPGEARRRTADRPRRRRDNEASP